LIDGCRLEQVLAENTEVGEHLGKDGLAKAMDPLQYTGVTGTFIDEVIERYENA